MDYHCYIFEAARHEMRWLDQGLSALTQDLHDRGLDKDVLVVAWDELGRTPRVNKHDGRDHWPAVPCALLAGGGMRTGQVIGSADAYAAEVKDRPVHFQDVFATLYRNVGIDLQTATVPDLTGRPHYRVDSENKPIQEVI